MPNHASDRRVVVTGLGVVTPLGNDLQTFWNNLIAGQCGIGPITTFDTTAFDTKIAALDAQLAQANLAAEAARQRVALVLALGGGFTSQEPRR